MDPEQRALLVENTAALERLNSSISREQGYNNLLLLRILLAMDLEAPEGVAPLLELIPDYKNLSAVVTPLGRPISKLDRQTTTSQTYIDIVEWEIPAGHTGELFEVYLATSSYAKTYFKLVIAGEEQWTDKYLVVALPQKFRGNKLTETMKVLIQARSTDGTSITAYGAIAGKLIPPPYRKAGFEA